MVVMYTALVLLACTPVFMKAKETGRKNHLSASKHYTENPKLVKIPSADVYQKETSDLEIIPKKDRSYNFEEIGLLNNSMDLLHKNCSNNATNYNCKLALTNCSKHCIKCVSQGACKGCEVGFYGQTCHSKCLLNCGAEGCNQHTGKCDVDVDLKIYFGAGAGAAAVSVIGLFLFFTWFKKKYGRGYKPVGSSMNNDCCNNGIFMMDYVNIKTILVLSVFVPVSIWTKEFKQRGTTIFFGDETMDLEDRPYKTHRTDFGDDNYTDIISNVTLKNCTNNTIDNNNGLWLKNCSNNSMVEDDVFGNCTKHCIECKDQECKGCEIGFYGQNCHLKCLLDCGVEGCYQFTGKCQGICNASFVYRTYYNAFITSPKTS
ncbi:unnamed protein product [Mytilus coruscus]|uniref:MEGF10_11 n=1 Tax=Mytilus coruscus TaxID=42192 RepID=A0A6J8CIA1_MYTCO|nr:unnamed protein product [Mytilus coruscus]